VQSNTEQTMYDSNSLDFPTIVQPTQKVKGKPYLISTLPIKITKYLEIDENTPLLIGVIRGTKAMIIQPVVSEPSSTVTIPARDIEREQKKPIAISEGEDNGNAQKIRSSALSFIKKE
jgi:hypothetical protein